jgi:predicted glycosyltransferase involved in capsule biosynthesis
VKHINPYKYIYWLNEQETKELSNENIKLIREIHQPRVITGGIFLIKKDIFLKIKGFDEDSFGWGFQDGIFDEKIMKLGLKIKITESIAIHLNHDGNLKPGSNNKISNDEYFSYTKRNLNITNILN